MNWNSQSIFMNPNHLKFLLAINDVRFWFWAEIVRFSVAIGNIKFFIKTEADGLCQPSWNIHLHNLQKYLVLKSFLRVIVVIVVPLASSCSTEIFSVLKYWIVNVKCIDNFEGREPSYSQESKEEYSRIMVLCTTIMLTVFSLKRLLNNFES